MDFLYAFIDSFVNLCNWNSTETYSPWKANKEDKVPERLVSRMARPAWKDRALAHTKPIQKVEDHNLLIRFHNKTSFCLTGRLLMM